MVKEEEEFLGGREEEIVECISKTEAFNNKVIHLKPCHILSTPPSGRRQNEAERASPQSLEVNKEAGKNANEKRKKNFKKIAKVTPLVKSRRITKTVENQILLINETREYCITQIGQNGGSYL